MAPIPAGQFFMGSDDKDALANEKPPHHVKLGAFCMDMTEVSVAKYQACSLDGKCPRAGAEVEWPRITDQDRKAYVGLCTVADPPKPDHPINCVTWENADRYCKAQQRRLPTEAEWEFAARGKDGRTYPWGDQPPAANLLNACDSRCVKWGKRNGVALEALHPGDDGFETTAPVGKFLLGRSTYGPLDMAGNVWEWTADWYADYSKGDAENPRGPEFGDRRVIRGGAWNGSYTLWARPSFRYAHDPSARSFGIGFRCAKSP
jgi:formylglycine-generating enzyme required for sulfatase activity